MKKSQLLLLILSLPFLIFAGYSGYQAYQKSTARADIMADYSEANSVLYGLFSVNEWRDHVKQVLAKKIENFEFNERQDSLLHVEVSEVLNSVIDKARQKVDQQEEQGFFGKVKKVTVNTLVNWDKLKAQSPDFADAIVREATSAESKERLKGIAMEELDKVTAEIHDDTTTAYLNQIYQSYDTEGPTAFNEKVLAQSQAMENNVRFHTYALLGVVLLFLIPWFFTKRFPDLRKPWFAVSVILAIIVLFSGLTSPMIEIDARIKNVDFVLLGEHIIFSDQILFYRSKSILEVVGLLMGGSRFDSVFVGILILSFSVILPTAKMISAPVYLFVEKLRSNKIIQWLAFKSGKWSMADVMVVAIFMAFVGFDGILDNQLTNFDIHTQNYTSISTNRTNIRPGFIIFTGYVLFGLILAQILANITRKSSKSNATSA